MNERRLVTRMRKKSIMESVSLSLSLFPQVELGTCVTPWPRDHVYLGSTIRLRFHRVARYVIAGQFFRFF